MRKVELGTLLTLDGVTDRPELAFTSAPGEPPAIDEVMDAHLADVISREDAVLLGRRMYDEWAGYWPSSPHQPFADFINGAPKHVVTSTPLSGPVWRQQHRGEWAARRGRPVLAEGLGRRPPRAWQHRGVPVAARRRPRRRVRPVEAC